jgi:pSer/pThr/pTyr-binding forkhead associated (FHA) protein
MAANNEPAPSGPLTVHLLDSALGQIVQTWRFRDRDTISIGRGPDNDIDLADPQVSRCHALLRFCDREWFLVSVGRNGTFVEGKSITEVLMCDQGVFQLGPSGPLVKYDLLPETNSWFSTVEAIEDELSELRKRQQGDEPKRA